MKIKLEVNCKELIVKYLASFWIRWQNFIEIRMMQSLGTTSVGGMRGTLNMGNELREMNVKKERKLIFAYTSMCRRQIFS